MVISTNRWYGRKRTGTAQPGWPHTWQGRWRSQTWSARVKQERVMKQFDSISVRTRQTSPVPESSSLCWPWGWEGPRWAGLGAPQGPHAAHCRRCGARSEQHRGLCYHDARCMHSTIAYYYILCIQLDFIIAFIMHSIRLYYCIYYAFNYTLLLHLLCIQLDFIIAFIMHSTILYYCIYYAFN